MDLPNGAFSMTVRIAGSTTVVDMTAANWQGAAPSARLAFQDLGQGNEGSLALPPNLVLDYFPYSYAWWVLLFVLASHILVLHAYAGYALP